METLTFADKFFSPLPWLPWIPVVLLGAFFILWLLDRWVFKKTDIIPQIRTGNIAMAMVVCIVIWAVVTIFGRAAFGQTAQYDHYFRRAGIHYFGSIVDWRKGKAQGMTESGLRRGVVSRVGACGLMQFMPKTARQFKIDCFRPREAIWAALRYDRQLWDQFRARRPLWDRWAFALMSYNAGLGNVLDWQRKAEARGANPNLFETLMPWIWKEPREYVLRAARWCARFGGWGC